jgi:multidrug efflux pump subunit AcrA (membrane-fusion protein)
MRFFRYSSATILLLAAALSTGCGSSKQGASAPNSSTSAANSNSAPSEASIPEVSTAEVIERMAQRTLEAVGSLEAEDEVTLSSQASGNLDVITVDVGSLVRRDQLIAKLDQRELSLKVDQAQAAVRQIEARLGIKGGEKIDPEKQPEVRTTRSALERARYDLTASKNLADHGDISKQQLDVYQRTYDQAEARYQAAQENVRNLEALLEEKRASLSLAKKQLSDVNITSPINGIVKEKQVSRGEYLTPGSPIATIVQINPLRLKLEIPESFAATVKAGQTVTLKVDTFGDREFTGRVKRINPTLDEKNRSLTAEAEVSNSDGRLKPGMFARARVASDQASAALMVPIKSVVTLAGVNKVFVLENGKAVERQVKLGEQDGTLVEILEGVKPGEKVITSNTDRLHDGIAVRI